jgi:hypothetical protein
VNPALARTLIEEHGVQPSPTHVEATANILASLFKMTAGAFAGLPLEAEPSAFVLEQRRQAP